MAETRMGTQATDPILPSDATPTNGMTFQPAVPDQDDESERLRGVVALPHQRSVLLTDQVELDVDKLPRWRPHIVVDERRITDDDNE
jgi:hypothetical protein